MKKIILANLFVLGVCLLTSCGAADNKVQENASANIKKETSTESGTDAVAQTDISGYNVKLVMMSGEKVTDELSPYYGQNMGEYSLQVFKDENMCSEMSLKFSGEETLYFPDNFDIKKADYNSDGIEDFAIGQAEGSNYMLYQFYTVGVDGNIDMLTIENILTTGIIANRDGYSPEFSMNNGQIEYIWYNQESGENEDRKVTVEAKDYENQIFDTIYLYRSGEAKEIAKKDNSYNKLTDELLYIVNNFTICKDTVDSELIFAFEGNGEPIDMRKDEYIVEADFSDSVMLIDGSGNCRETDSIIVQLKDDIIYLYNNNGEDNNSVISFAGYRCDNKVLENMYNTAKDCF